MKRMVEGVFIQGDKFYISQKSWFRFWWEITVWIFFSRKRNLELWPASRKNPTDPRYVVLSNWHRKKHTISFNNLKIGSYYAVKSCKVIFGFEFCINRMQFKAESSGYEVEFQKFPFIKSIAVLEELPDVSSNTWS